MKTAPEIDLPEGLEGHFFIAGATRMQGMVKACQILHEDLIGFEIALRKKGCVAGDVASVAGCAFLLASRIFTRCFSI